ncbi:MAG: DUF2520 domain-containing protein [Eubacterium sp.]|nr:DUF2520 domain-containing protein [Eubacterium sp.]
MKKIGFIGAGRVAVSIGKYLLERGIPVVGYYDTSPQSADEAATFTDSQAFTSEQGVIAAGDVIFIATPDDVIATVWNKIKPMNINGKVIGMFSGSLSSNLFSGIDEAGAYGASIHPMYAFSDIESDYLKLNTVPFTVEGDEQAVDFLCTLFRGLGHTITVISPEDKVRYHAAASIASNHMIALYDMSLSMLTDCGFSREGAVLLLTPLIQNNVSAMLKTSPEDALTGPIERGDVDTVRHHLQDLTDEERAIYKPLAMRLISISEKKHPERSYDEMRKLLTQ